MTKVDDGSALSGSGRAISASEHMHAQLAPFLREMGASDAPAFPGTPEDGPPHVLSAVEPHTFCQTGEIIGLGRGEPGAVVAFRGEATRARAVLANYYRHEEAGKRPLGDLVLAAAGFLPVTGAGATIKRRADGPSPIVRLSFTVPDAQTPLVEQRIAQIWRGDVQGFRSVIPRASGFASPFWLFQALRRTLPFPTQVRIHAHSVTADSITVTAADAALYEQIHGWSVPLPENPACGQCGAAMVSVEGSWLCPQAVREVLAGDRGLTGADERSSEEQS